MIGTFIDTTTRTYFDTHLPSFSSGFDAQEITQKITSGNKDFLSAVEKGLFNMQDKTEGLDSTYLHWVLASDNTEGLLSVLKALEEADLIKYVDLKTQDGYKKTLLMLGIAKKYMNTSQQKDTDWSVEIDYNLKHDYYDKYNKHDDALIEFLINKADAQTLLMPDKNGNTPMHIAVIKRDMKTVELLLKRAYELGMDNILEVKNSNGYTPMECFNIVTYNIAKTIVDDMYDEPSPMPNETDWQNNKEILQAFLHKSHKYSFNKIITAQNQRTTDNDLSIDDLISAKFKIDDPQHHFDWIIFPCISKTKPYLSYKKDEDEIFYKKLIEVQENKYVKLLEKYTKELQEDCKVPIRMSKAIQFIDALPESFFIHNFNLALNFLNVVKKHHSKLCNEYYKNCFESLQKKMTDLYKKRRVVKKMINFLRQRKGLLLREGEKLPSPMTHIFFAYPRHQIASVKVDNDIAKKTDEYEKYAREELKKIVEKTSNDTQMQPKDVRKFLSFLGSYAEDHPNLVGKDAGFSVWIKNSDFKKEFNKKFADSVEDVKKYQRLSAILQKNSKGIFDTVEGRRYNNSKVGARSFRLGMLMKEVTKVKFSLFNIVNQIQVSGNMKKYQKKSIKPRI